VLSNFSIELPQGHYPTLLLLDYSERQGISNDTLWPMLPDFGPPIEQQYLQTSGQCAYETRQQRTVAGYPSIRGTYQCVTSDGSGVIVMLEQVDLRAEGQLTAIFQTDERAWLPRVRDLNEILDSFRLTN